MQPCLSTKTGLANLPSRPGEREKKDREPPFFCKEKTVQFPPPWEEEMWGQETRNRGP